MRLLVVGCNHRTSPVALRERLSLSGPDLIDALRDFKAHWPQAEGLLLCTCNRSELYVARPLHQRPSVADMIEFIGRRSRLAAGEFMAALYHYEDAEALRHLFTVVSSLDSLVVGEPQILGQAKDALNIAMRARSAGTMLSRAFQAAFACAKRVRSETGIGAGRTSVGSIAVDFARQVLGSLHDKTVLMIGAGKMGQLALRHLLQFRPARLVAVNRTRRRAEEIAHAFGAEVGEFARLLEHIAEADLVLSCTGSPEYLVTAEQFGKVAERRQGRPLLIIDIAVPRDFDPEIAGYPGIHLHNIDDLQQAVEQSLAQRKEQIAAAEAIVDSAVTEFLAKQTLNQAADTIRALERKLQQIGQQELQWVLPKLTGDREHDRKLLQQFQHRLLAKILYHPAKALEQKARNGSPRLYAQVLREVFELHDEPEQEE